MSRELLGKTTVETSFSIKSNTYYMKVLCVNGYENVLTEGEVYTVAQVTTGNNFLLEEIDVPEGYTSFNSNRFVPLITSDEDSLDETFLEHKPTAVFYCIDL
jgi:hypothetical protein